MGRPKKFNRDEVLEAAASLFWGNGFAATSLQDLEKATHVNKSGLYSEFESKEDIYLSCLRHYMDNRGGKKILATEPLGYDNIEKFLKNAQVCLWGRTGCFAINSVREFSVLPSEALEMVEENHLRIKHLIARNIEVEQTNMGAEAIADIVMTFFTGLCMEQNFDSWTGDARRKIDDMMRIIRSL